MAYPQRYHLSFALPATAGFQSGKHRPNPEGCLLHVSHGGLVRISGPSREDVIETAERLLRRLPKPPACGYVTAMLVDGIQREQVTVGKVAAA